MNAKIYAINQVTDEIFKISGTYELGNDTNSPVFFLQERIPIDDFIIPERIYLDVNWVDNNFELLVDFEQVVQNSKKSMIWDCFFSVENLVNKLTYDISGIDYSKEYTNIDITINMYQTKIKTVALSIKSRPKQVKNLEIKAINDNIVGNFELESSMINEIETDKVAIIAKKRIQNDILYHSDSIIIESAQINDIFHFEIDYKLFFTHGSHIKCTWDFFIDINFQNKKEKTHLPLVFDSMKLTGTEDLFNKNIEFKFYQNYRKALSLSTVINRNEELFKVRNLKIDENSIKIICDLSEKISINKILLKKDSKYKYGDLSVDYIQLPFHCNDQELIINTNSNEILSKLFLEDGSKFIIELELNEQEQGVKYFIPLVVKEHIAPQHFIINNYYQATVTKDHQHQLSIIIKGKTLKSEESAINIAVSGSCFSRLAFSSNEFYNPNYKDKYKLSFTQFHSSIVSIMSNPVEFPEKEFIGFNEREVEYIKSDYKKDFFKMLELEKPNFFILDFYVDGSKDLLVFDKEHIVTINYMLRRNTNYLFGVKNNVKVLTHENIADYLNIWCAAVEEFAKKIVQIIPEERIILQRVRKTEKFINKDGKKEQFKDIIRHVKRSNYLFEYMEDYFLKLLPNINTINLSSKEYFSIENHPEGKTPDHLESEYYRDFLKQLNEICLKKLIRN